LNDSFWLILSDFPTVAPTPVVTHTGVFPLFWKTWKSQGIEKWSGKMNYYTY